MVRQEDAADLLHDEEGDFPIMYFIAKGTCTV
jgi:hypothetical protein